MTTIVPVSFERHGKRAWDKAANLPWARQHHVVPVGLQEAMQLMTSLSLGFLSHEGEQQLVVLLGVHPGESLLVSPEGRWLAPRMPGVLRHHPFKLMRSPDGKDLLGIDEDGLLPAGSVGGTALYDEDAKPVAELSTILERLAEEDRERQHSRKTALALHQLGLLEPWNIKIQEDEGEVIEMEGVFRVNEAKLNEISADDLLTLRNAGALLMAYVQLLSMQNLQQLARLGAARRRMKPRKAAGDDFGIISFENL